MFERRRDASTRSLLHEEHRRFGVVCTESPTNAAVSSEITRGVALHLLAYLRTKAPVFQSFKPVFKVTLLSKTGQAPVRGTPPHGFDTSWRSRARVLDGEQRSLRELPGMDLNARDTSRLMFLTQTGRLPTIAEPLTTSII
jgi:hypothetical protein